MSASYVYSHAEPVLVEAVDSSSTLTAISASLGALCVVTLLIGVIAGCLVSRTCMARADIAPITEVELNRLPTTTTAVPVPMYEDIDDVALNSTTFRNTIVMEDNEAYGHKVALQ